MALRATGQEVEYTALNAHVPGATCENPRSTGGRTMLDGMMHPLECVCRRVDGWDEVPGTGSEQRCEWIQKAMVEERVEARTQRKRKALQESEVRVL